MTKCLHCNYEINGFNEEDFIEVISDFTTMETRFCCKNCFVKHYDLNNK